MNDGEEEGGRFVMPACMDSCVYVWSYGWHAYYCRGVLMTRAYHHYQQLDDG